MSYDIIDWLIFVVTLPFIWFGFYAALTLGDLFSGYLIKKFKKDETHNSKRN